MGYDEDWWTAEAMRRRGGSFVRALGEAFAHADTDNMRRIKEAWPEYWAKYSELGVAMREKDKALEESKL